MTILTPSEVIQMAKDRGASDEIAHIFAAICKAESGLDTSKEGDISLEDATWGPSMNIPQIRSLKAQTGTGLPRDVQRLTDVNFAVDSAKIVSEGWTTFHPWTTFNNGAYKAFLAEMQSAPPPAQPHPCAGLKGAAPAGFRILRLTHPFMRGNDVREAQQRLHSAGFTPGNSEGPDGFDGIYGPATALQVTAIEKAKGLSVEDPGIVGPQVWCVLGVG